VSARILALLARAHLPAAFFMVGRQAAAHPQLVRRVAQAGQVVGGHTWNHARLDRLPSARVAAEVDCTNQLLARLAGRPVRLVRPPDGAYDRGVVDRLAAPGAAADPVDGGLAGLGASGGPPDRGHCGPRAASGAIIVFQDGGGDRS
jgi:peptidoglycan/xylan/chitin deacetylase (PgdA/CDA1 family)